MEGFFYVGSFIDSKELKELLLRRYHSLAFIADMDLIEFAEFVVYVREKEQEEKIYQQWLAMLPALSKYVEFDDFKTMVLGSAIDMRSDEEIIKEIEEAQQKAGFEWKYSS